MIEQKEKLDSGIKDIYPLSPMQQGMLFHYLKDNKSQAYVEQNIMELEGELEPEILRQSISRIVERHDVLRTAFVHEGIREPMQVVLKEREAEFSYEDLAGVGSADKKIEEYIEADRVRGFDLTKEILMRVCLFRTSVKNYKMIWSFHHIIMDGWCLGIIIKETIETYYSLVKGEAAILPASEPYSRYIKWLSKQDREVALKFWGKYLSGYFEKAELPFTKGYSGISEYRHEEIITPVRCETVRKLEAAARNMKVTLNSLIQTIWGILLQKYNNTEDVVFGTVVSGRPPEIRGIESMVGLFINTIPVRIKCSSDTTLNALTLNTQEQLFESDRYAYLQLTEINALSPLKNELINHIMVFENFPIEERLKGEAGTGSTIRICEMRGHDQINYDFAIVVMPGRKMNIRYIYNGNVYEKEFIETLSRHFLEALDRAADNSEITVLDLQEVTEEEKIKLLYQFNDTKADYPEDNTIHRLFEEQVERTPDNTALICGNEVLTYRELNNRANLIAARLKKLGVERESIVAIITERSFEMIAGILGILKAGGGYLPIDPSYPLQRIRYMLEDSGAATILTKAGLLNQDWTADFESERQVVYLDEPGMYDGVAQNPSDENKPSDMAYVIYTSGTTGNPKGAVVEHKNVVRLMFNDKIQFDFCDRDVWTLFHSYCFDFSVWEMYGALLYGGKLVIVPKTVAQSPGEFIKLLEKEKVTVLNQTPTGFGNLVREAETNDAELFNIRYIIFGGEALKPALLKSWMEKYPDTKFINMYGITETTVHVTYKEITRFEVENNVSNIGRPIPTLTAYIMDKNLRLQPVGAAGELCVGGEGVCRGYLNRPELTADKFIQNPYNEKERLYRSGDLARMLPDGEMEYLGRIDHQVKIRGHRIELGEIENCLLQLEGIKEAVVLAEPDENGDMVLTAYIASDSEQKSGQLREHLSHSLPGYMIPGAFVKLAQIPVTSNGKVDRKALALLQKQNGSKSNVDAGVPYRAPVTEAEEKLTKVWQDVLGLEKIGTDNNFFTSGGDSIKAIRVVNRMNIVMGTNFKIQDLYKYQTISEISEYLKTPEVQETDALKAGNNALESIKSEILKDKELSLKLPGSFEDFYLLSPIQQGMVFLNKLMPDEPIYHDQFPYVIKIKNFDMGTFNKAVDILVKQHSILRTTFMMNLYKEPIQVVYKAGGGIVPQIEMDDLSDFDASEQEIKIADYMQNDLRNKFKLDNELLWRMRAIKLGNDNYCILLSFHHAVLDGWSVASLMSELFYIFEKLAKGEMAKVQSLKNSYREYVAWTIGRKAMEDVVEFWKRFFEGYSRNKLPFNISNNKVSDKTGRGILKLDLDGNLLSSLEEKAKTYSCTVKDICLAAHIYLLGILSTERDVVTGVVTHDRPVMEDSEKILGCFLNTIPIRVSTENRIGKLELIERVKDSYRKIKSNELFLGDIAGIIGESGVNGNPIFDTLFNFTDFHVLNSVPGIGIVEQADSNVKTFTNEMTNTFFDLEISKTLDVFSMQIKYSRKYFYPEEIETASGLYVRILEAFAKEDSNELSLEEVIKPLQLKEIVYDFNNTALPYAKEKTMHGLFEKQAEKNPGNVALITDDRQMTYGELNERANRLAGYLIDKGVRNGDLVGLVVQRDFEMIIGMFAILKCGGAYVPIDPAYPAARQEYILTNSKVSAVLVDSDYEIDNGNIIRINSDEVDAYPSDNLDIKKASGDLAYVIYTSGSTGTPKGVMIEHHSAVNLISWVNREFNVSAKDSLLFITSMCFDLSVYDIFGMLAAGGKVVIAKKKHVQEPDELKILLLNHKITFWDSVPSTMNYLVANLEDKDSTYLQENLRLVFMSGDWIPVQLPAKLVKFFPNACVISLGGATEGTVWSIYYPVKGNEGSMKSIPYGKPIDNNTFYILDNERKPLPKGVAGELYIGGVGVARGYINRPDLTNERFVPDQFYKGNMIESPMMYRTGDLGRFLPDGNIEFLGRMDYQVKIRGYRVELGEIESKLHGHSLVKAAVVVDKTDSSGNKYLCAYIVWEQECTVSEMRSFLSAELPEYMIPTYFVGIDKIPLNSNGKIDRKALPEPGGNICTGKDYTPAETETEEKLSAIWKEVLEIDEISVEDNFFELGGHSLKATAVTSQVSKVFNVELPLVELFRTPTVRELATYIDNASESGHKTIKPSKKREFYPVSSAQRRIYIIDRIDNSKAVYNIPGVLVIEGNFDRSHFESVISKLAIRHEAFRTQFEIVDGEPVQRIVGNVEIPISYIEGLELDIETEALKFLRPFDLSKAPLLRVGVMRINSQKHVFMFDMHHIISDGTSMAILINEFISLYNGEALEDTGLRYRDFSEWQNGLIKNGELKKQEEYWLEKYSGEIPVLNLPLDYQRPALQDFEGAAVSFEVGPELLTKLKKAAGSGKTLFMELLAAYSILLSEYSGQEDIVIGSTIAGRHHADLQNIIGMFVNTLAIRSKPLGDNTIGEFMDEVKKNALEAYENQDYQFEELVSKLNLERDLSRNPLFSAMLTMQNVDFKGREINGLAFKPYSMERKTAKFDLLLEAMEVENRIEFTLEYATSLFKRETIEQMTKHFIKILDAVASDSGKKIKDIDLLSLSEKEAIVSCVNVAANGKGFKTIHEMFEEQVVRTPNKTALEYDNKKYTYLELNEKANRLAWLLREKGLNPGQPAGIMAKRSLEFVTAVLAVLKAGGHIVPIDPEYPEERIQYMLEDSGARILLTQGVLREGVDFKGQILNLENADIYSGSSSNPENLNNPMDLLYIIYTSGTTGKPKGVMLEHRNMMNLIEFQCNKTNIDFSKKVLQFATVSFDVCYQETFGTLLSGGELLIAGEEEKKDAEKLFRFIEDRDIRVIFLPTAFLKFILKEKKYVELLPRSIEHIITAGEQLIVNGELKSFMKSNGVYLHNHYGPSETHVATTYTMGPEDEVPDIPPIGKPISNVGIYILSKNGRMQPAGIPGEIYITGAATGRGYINLPALTSEKFLDDPYVAGSRMYKTGDLARRLPDRNIEFLGRADDQVKVRGYRIELGEIETQLLKHPLVKEAIVIVKNDRNGEKIMCAYIATEEEVNVADIRGYLQKGLPDFMIPSRFINLPKMPLMKNGKVDRQALLEFNDTIDLGAEYVAPRNKREADLAEIWSNLLDVDKVGVHDEFFLLGGDSLKALKAANEAKLKGFQISIADIFRYKTIAKIVENISTGDLEADTPKIPEEEKQEVYKTENCWHPFSMYVKNEEHVKELKIELQREVTLNGHRALPLCIILADPKLHTWYFQRYVNIFSFVDDNDYLKLEYLETWAPYRDVINEISLGAPLMEREPDIIGFITDKISRGYYLNVAIDEYYIPGKARYKKTHYVHHTLIYGYNNIQRQFNVIEYDIGGVLNKHIFSYDAVSKAYEKGKEYYSEPASSWAYESAVQIFYMNRFECEHPFRLKRFAQDIKNYLYSKGDDSIVYYWKMSKEHINYGFAVHDIVLRALHGFIEGKFLTDYRAVHMLAEHKKGIATRLNFIMNRFELQDILLEKYEEYMEVVEEFNNIRLKFFNLQYNISQERIEESKLKLKAEIENLIQAITLAKQREWPVLKEIYKILIRFTDESLD